jgi:mRNA-degrading endonuclease RelE of RelBE toxin-antitoxin system
MSYSVVYSPSVRAELDRLLAGNDDQRKRYQAVIDLVERIKNDAHSGAYIKRHLSHYKAGKLGPRYRLFFEVFDGLKTGNYIHIVWLNDETQQHSSGSAFDIYEIFKAMMAAGTLAKFVEPRPVSTPLFTLNPWGPGFLYAELKTNKPQSANASLSLELQASNAYKILDRLTVDPDDDTAFAILFIKHICENADVGRIHLSMELRVTQIDYALHVDALKANGFQSTISSGNDEVWERKPQKSTGRNSSP